MEFSSWGSGVGAPIKYHCKISASLVICNAKMKKRE